MSDYKQKYLKYKNKYLQLKSDLEIQKGGNYYTSGVYAFFLSSEIIDKNIIDIIDKKNIDNFDDFTTKLGNCALFLRIGSTTSGRDFSNTYNTIYPNKSSLSVVGTKALDATKYGANQAWDATKYGANQAWDATKYGTNQAWDATKYGAKQAWDAAKQGVQNLSKKPVTTNIASAPSASSTSKPVTVDAKTVIEDEDEEYGMFNFADKSLLGGVEMKVSYNCNFQPMLIKDLTENKYTTFSQMNQLDGNAIKTIITNINKNKANIVRVLIITKRGNIHRDAEITHSYLFENNEVVRKY